MLLWVEIPSPHSSTQRSRENHWAELQRMLVFIGSHPSIVIWSLYNEDWGAEDIRTNPETRRYIASTFDYSANARSAGSHRGQRRLESRFALRAAEITPFDGARLYARFGSLEVIA